MSIHGYLPNDAYKPPIDKPSLGQYDPYQLHNIYCDDTEYQPITINNQNFAAPNKDLFNNWLAVERMSPSGAIECDFNAIAVEYP
jgi:hypothetical protein